MAVALAGGALGTDEGSLGAADKVVRLVEVGAPRGRRN